MASRKKDLLDMREASYNESMENHNYYIPLGDEENRLGLLRSCRISGNRIVIIYSKRAQAVEPFPEPVAATFTPKFK
jgi:hypothetical protein